MSDTFQGRHFRGDKRASATYFDIMETQPDHLLLTLELKQPIEIGDFVSAFTSISLQYERYMKENHPDFPHETKVYVKEVRKGSIIAELIPVAVDAFHTIETIVTLNHFVQFVEERILPYMSIGGKSTHIRTDSEFKEVISLVKGVANDPNGKATLQSITLKDGEKEISAAFVFDTEQAKIAVRQIDEHIRQIEHKNVEPHHRVLMIFVQSNTKYTEPDKRTGERVIIEEIESRDLPLFYKSEIAEQKIKHHIVDENDNVFRKGFVVDVFSIKRNGKIVSYGVTDFHHVIDID